MTIKEKLNQFNPFRDTEAKPKLCQTDMDMLEVGRWCDDRGYQWDNQEDYFVIYKRKS